MFNDKLSSQLKRITANKKNEKVIQNKREMARKGLIAQ